MLPSTSPGPAQATARLAGASTSPPAATVRGFQLEIIDSDEPPRDLAGGRCTVGSSEHCALVIDDATVSRFHCDIEIDDQGARIRDLDSKNGTSVDGTRVVQAFLKSGSLIRIGRTTLRFQFLGRRSPLALSARTCFGRLVGGSVAMRALFAVLEKIAATDSKVLLEGETGTGKSLTARAIHAESSRQGGPFIKVDCGAIPQNLLESELFGHVKGAFTGAAASRLGAFEAAHQGTLFLDEIGELPLELQPKLLDVLENREIHRVGEDRNRARPVDVRIIAATNRDLRAEVNAGRFREDLYYRLAVAPVRLPPLRQRAKDMPLLARAILQGLDIPDKRIDALLTSEFVADLQSAAWPGNIRQLGNHLERCVVFDSPVPLDMDAGQAPIPDHELRMPIDPAMPFHEFRDAAVAEAERAYVLALLDRHDHHVARAAKAARVHRSYLYKLMQRHHITPPAPRARAPESPR